MLIIFLISFENQCASTKLVPVEFVDLSTSIKIQLEQVKNKNNFSITPIYFNTLLLASCALGKNLCFNIRFVFKKSEVMLQAFPFSLTLWGTNSTWKATKPIIVQVLDAKTEDIFPQRVLLREGKMYQENSGPTITFKMLSIVSFFKELGHLLSSLLPSLCYCICQKRVFQIV